MLTALPRTTSLALAAALLAGTASAQSVWFVDATATGPGTGSSTDPYPEIQDAIDAAATVDGDVVLVRPGTYAPIDLLSKTLDLRSTDGADLTTIDGGRAVPTVRVTGGSGPGTRLEGFRLQAGKGAGIGVVTGAGGGGVLVVSSWVEISGCSIADCNAGTFATLNQGGGVGAFAGATVRIVDSTIEGCTADRGGGVYGFDTTLEIERTTIRDNGILFFSFDGGGLRIQDGSLTMHDCEVLDNRGFFGAGVDVESSTAHFERTLFRGNTETNGCAQGGAIRGSGTIRACDFVDNRAQFGGALYGSFDVEGSSFVGNGFDQFEANFGGAVYGQGTTVVRDSLFEGNFCFGQGGAVHDAALERCVVRDNSAFVDTDAGEDGLGGGLFQCDATDCRIEGNTAVGVGTLLVARGGGAFGGTLTRCVVVDNAAPEGGGAAAASLVNCTVWGNQGGGAIGAVTATSCLVWDNVPYQLGDDGTGLPTATWSDVQGGAAGATNIDADPVVWGPESRDLRLRAGSPCIDGGDPMATDPDGSRVDIGALPFDPTYVAAPGGYCEGKVTSEGCTAITASVGAPSLSGGFYEVRAEEVPANTLGLVFLAREPASTPYLFGTLCVGGPLVRQAPVSATGAGACGGTLRATLNPADLSAGGFTVGDRIYAQWFFRDVAQPDGTGLGLTDGVEAVVLP
ncbi:MAG: right-handed parallel beta-helix repeat-containing protein [Planctomycetota bacterium]